VGGRNLVKMTSFRGKKVERKEKEKEMWKIKLLRSD
jgi:hypothetical protein